MRVGFYAPMKPPDHPVPSGDRQMARLLVAALRLAGHEVELYSRFRSFAAEPGEPTLAGMLAEAAGERDRLVRRWAAPGVGPDILFTYHTYYKAPDLLGPGLAAALGRPYVTAEATLSERRETGAWASRQAIVAAGVRQAALSFWFTERDRAGLSGTVEAFRLAELPPFVDAAAFPERRPSRRDGPLRLITVAMMRAGDKARSYRCLAEALALLDGVDWHLTVVGDGPDRAAVRDAFASLPSARLAWRGACPSEAVPALIIEADLMVWPGFNEAFGLCYLEAQASGVPVVAVRNAGTPSVVRDGETGLLTGPEPADVAAAVERLASDAGLREGLGRRARAFVHGERGLPAASRRLAAALESLEGSQDRLEP